MKKLMFLVILFLILLGRAYISYCCDGVPVLTYHSHNIGYGGICEYPGNSHLALEQDLEIINSQGFKIIPLKWVVEWRLGYRSLPEHSIAITFDDGADMDWIDYNDAVCGMTKSFRRILEEFQLKHLEQDSLQATSFVIGSPLYRRLIAKELLHDYWWKEASDSELFAIQNHSYTHGQRHGAEDFWYVDTYKEASEEIPRSAKYIKHKTKIYPDIFAYPWGNASNYLKDEYLPKYKKQHKTVAAFGGQPECVKKESDIWELPRFVFIRDWSSPEEFRTFLEGLK